MYKYENDETFLLQSAQIVQKENNRKSNQVWLESPTGDVMDILPFYVVPGELTIRKEDKEQILAYESYTGKSIKFFSPEGTEKQTSGRILEKLNLLLRDKQKEKAFSSEEFTKEIFLSRVAEENKLILDTLIAEKKVIPGVYVHREDMEIKLREWIGARANIFVIAAEAGSGKTNLLVDLLNLECMRSPLDNTAGTTAIQLYKAGSQSWLQQLTISQTEPHQSPKCRWSVRLP
jgi:hypothetical protein